MKILKAVLFVVLLFPMALFAGDLPDKKLTPGVTNPNVTQNTIDSTICIKGWTKTIRPPTSYTNKLKLRQINEQGLSGTPKDYEEDHLIPLELGGAPFDEKNLWPEPWDGDKGAHQKDKLENKLHKLVCNHKLPLQEAQKALSDSWVDAYKVYFAK